MVRISLQEQYDNKDVIQQIYKLKDDVTQTKELASGVPALSGQISAAVSASQEAVQEVTGLRDTVAGHTEAITNVEIDTEEALTVANDAVKELSITSTTTAGTLNITRGTGFEEYKAFPIADATKTGLMNAQTYIGLQNLGDRVSRLEAQSTVYYGVFTSTTPSAVELTSIFNSVAGRAPVAGDYLTDIAKNLTYGYNGTTWIKVEGQGTPVFGTGTAGLIVGSTEDGTIAAESDGTGSVNGWDAVKAHIASSEQLIQQNTANIATKQNILTSTTVTLPSASWSGNAQTVGVAGVTANNIVWVSPAPASFTAYADSLVRATAQGAGTLTFTCDGTPSVDITVNVVIA